MWCEIDQISVGVNPRRQDIVDRLAAFGPLSVKALARWLGAKPSALYHHLKLLTEAGLVIEAGSVLNRRRRELLYATPSRDMRLRLRPEDPTNREAVQAFVRALGNQIERDFTTGQAAPNAEPEGPARNLALRRICASPDTATLVKINGLLEQIDALLLNSRGADGQGVVLTWTLAPLPSPGTGSDGS